MTRNLALLYAFLSCTSCSTLFYSPQNAKIKDEIAQAEHFAGQGNYKEAIAVYERTIKEASENPWQNQVLFNLGCLYALNENPDKDFARSLFYLQRLKEEFPKSRFKAEIQLWIGFLEQLFSLEFELTARKVEFAAEKFSLEQEITKLKTKNLELESSWSTEINLKTKKLKELEALIQAQKTAIGTLRQQLKKMKEIDIQSEKKTKEIK